MKKHFIAPKWLGYTAIILICSCTLEKEVEIPEHIEKLNNLTVYSKDTSPVREIKLIREQAFGTTDEVLLGRLGSIGVDKSDRVFIEDIDKKNIHVFAHDGSHISQFGREGSGPGEFISDKVFEQRYLKHLISRVGGEYRSTSFEFMGRPLLAVSNEEHIFSAWSPDFLIKVRDSTGTYQRAFYYPVPKRKFTQEEALKKYGSDYHQGLIRNAASEDFPQSWPVLDAMLFDDKNRLWVSIIVDDQNVSGGCWITLVS